MAQESQKALVFSQFKKKKCMRLSEWKQYSHVLDGFTVSLKSHSLHGSILWINRCWKFCILNMSWNLLNHGWNLLTIHFYCRIMKGLIFIVYWCVDPLPSHHQLVYHRRPGINLAQVYTFSCEVKIPKRSRILVLLVYLMGTIIWVRF